METLGLQMDVGMQSDSPRNVAAERALLAGIFKHGSDAFIDVSDLVSSDTFTVEENSAIYRCIVEIFNRGGVIDVPSILSMAESLDIGSYFQTIGVLEHLRSVANTNVEFPNIRKHAATIKRLQFARELQDAARISYAKVGEVDGSESLSEILAKAEAPIQDLTLRYQGVTQDNPIIDLATSIDDYIKDLEESEIGSAGIMGGYPIWENAIGGGFNRKCVDLVCARTGEGKSQLADNIAINVGKQGIKTFILDTEMGKKDHFNRLLSRISRVNVNEINNKTYRNDPEKIERIRKAGETLKKIPYSFRNVSGMGISEALTLVKRWLIKEVGYDKHGVLNDCLFIYDYIQVTDSSELDSMAEYQVLGFYIKAIHNFCVANDLPCLLFAQSNREGADNPANTSVGGSDRIAQVATSISFFMSKAAEEMAEDGQDAGNRKMIITKARHGGGLPNDYICMHLEGEFATLIELGTRNALYRKRQNRRLSQRETCQTKVSTEGEGAGDSESIRSETYAF